ncbi:hypothetical protein [Paenibacillus contaminans]|jgi:hypothetical protein|uniref:DUF2642 domain-containing protein n=1 Tax=Paenibacillus contaminans TaxID=450362 RepID=A0A329MCJ6_9BACL|nr:hypothetical protein [Paenibacillus contaminans]RAV16363.1 hypothetical protein DQG23_28495 [Paenibacillus contaminans]
MAQTFSEIVEKLIADQSIVTIGSGENEITGSIAAFDREAKVFTYVERNNPFTHLIPLASVRSIGVEQSGNLLSCYLELFKR